MRASLSAAGGTTQMLGCAWKSRGGLCRHPPRPLQHENNTCRAARQVSCSATSSAPPSTRRQCLAAIALLVAAGPGRPAWAAAAAGGGSGDAAALAAEVQRLQGAAAQAYADRDFAKTVQLLNQILAMDPSGEGKWREMRAQALVDGKNFPDAILDFNATLALLQRDPSADVARARLLSGRGLAYEGLGDWVAALADYDKALVLAEAAGQYQDPYVLNSRGNCHASLGEWKEARENFLASSEGFQKASGFRYGRSTTPRLDGAIFAASNAALMLAQLGQEEAAMKEMRRVARRAPGSVDMRAALAALYWRAGDEGAAEAEWDFACDSISVGCGKYSDPDWLFRIRRWPPVMCEYMKDFLALRSQKAKAASSSSRTAATA